MAVAVSAGYRWAPITPDNHAGFIYIATLLSLTYSSLTFIARCGIKWHVFGFDDWVAVVAQVVTTIQFAVLASALSSGLGRSYNLLTEDQYLRMASTEFSNQILLYISLGVSKCATVSLIQRLFTRDAKKFWMICNIVTGIMILWTIFAALMVSVGCSPTSAAPITADRSCSGLLTRYRIIVATDCFTDVLLVLVPAYLVWQLQMSKLLKMQVISAFAFRLPLLALSILSLTYFGRSLRSSNPGVDRTPFIVFQQSALCFSLIAATIPCLKSFIGSFDTGSGVKVGYTTHAYGSSGNAYGGSYRMQSLSGSGSALRSLNGDLKISSKRFHGGGHGRSGGKSTTEVSHTPGTEDASIKSGHGSQEMIIRRDVQWEVRSETVQ